MKEFCYSHRDGTRHPYCFKIAIDQVALWS